MSEAMNLKPVAPKTANPVVAIVGAITLSLLMVSVTFVLFLRSSAYETVQQLHDESLLQPVDLGPGVDTTSPVKGTDIDAFGAKIEQRARAFNDTTDFDTDELSEEAFGF